MTTYFNDAEIPMMLKDFGVSVHFDSINTELCLVDYVDIVALRQNGMQGVINKAITVQLQTSKFPSLVSNDAVGKPIVVDGVAYTIRERLQQSDGAMTHLLVIK